MKKLDPKFLPVINYDAKRKAALSWLGDRYLLARPVRPLPPVVFADRTRARIVA